MEKKHQIIIDQIINYDHHEGSFKWHLSTNPDLVFSSRYISTYFEPTIKEGEVLDYNEDNYLQINGAYGVYGEVKILSLETADYLYEYNADLVGITGTMHYDDSPNNYGWQGWYLKSDLFPAPIRVYDSCKEDFEEYEGKKVALNVELEFRVK